MRMRWQCVVLSLAAALHGLRRAHRAEDCSCEACCTALVQHDEVTAEGIHQCSYDSLGAQCAETCVPPREGAQVVLGATSAGIMYDKYCLLSCMPIDQQANAACRTMTFEERKLQVTADGLGQNAVIPDVEEVVGIAVPGGTPAPTPTPKPTFPSDALGDLLAATERANKAAEYAR